MREKIELCVKKRCVLTYTSFFIITIDFNF